MGILQLSKQYDPDFTSQRSNPFEPVKPIGPVELDWDVLDSLGIAGNLKTYMYPQGAGYVELVSSQLPSNRGNAWSVSTDIRGQFPDAGNQSMKFPSAANKLQGADAFTVISSFKFNSVSTFSSVFRHDGSITLLQQQAGGDLRVIIWTPGIFIINTSVTAVIDRWYTLSLTRDDADAVRVFVDSSLDQSPTRSGSLDTSSKDFVFGGTETNTEDFNGQLGPYIAFDIELSDHVRGLIEKDPYILLKPANNPVYFTSSVAPADFTGTISVTLDDDSSIANSILSYISSLANQEELDTSSSSALLIYTSSLANQEENDTSVAIGTVTVTVFSGAIVITSEDDSSIMIGVIPIPSVTITQAMVDHLRGLGFIGGAADLQMQWLASLGFTAESLDDRWKEMLDAEPIEDGGMSERKRAFYETLVGSSPNLSTNELKRAYWLIR